MPDTIFQILKNQLEIRPKDVCIIGVDRDPITYRQVFEQLNLTNQQLNAMGIGREDRVGIVLPNGPEMVIESG